MSADPLIYCLERLTDYRQFERLCSDLMAGSGFPDIEPLGGSGDGGRDALHRRLVTEPKTLTIFAYTVRRDWRKKLNEDCGRIRDEKHEPDSVVFVCTSTLTAGEKDNAKLDVKRSFGWDLEVFDLERLRVLLTGPLRHLVASHPTIFCPPWFRTQGGLSVATSRDTVVIDHGPADHALAHWIAQRLSLSGFNTWCHGTAPLAGEDADTSVRALVEERANQYLPVLSGAATSEPTFMARCGAAVSRLDFVLPCWATSLDRTSLGSKLGGLEPARFYLGWSIGLRDVISALQGRGIEPVRPANPADVALRSYLHQKLIHATPERLYSNVFPLKVPPALVITHLRNAIGLGTLSQLRREWACVEGSPKTLFSFEAPPSSLSVESSSTVAWDEVDKLGRKPTLNVIKELVRRSMDLACLRARLVWCDHRKVYYFPHVNNKPLSSVSLRHVDGRATHVAMTGERQRGWGERATRFRYQLGPRFTPGRDESGAWWLTMRLYVRVTQIDGTPFEEKEIGKHRKSATKSWWNKEWLARTLGLMQALETGHEEVVVGKSGREIVVSTRPLSWECPMSIDVVAVDRLGDLTEEMAAIRSAMEDDEDESDQVVETPQDE